MVESSSFLSRCAGGQNGVVEIRVDEKSLFFFLVAMYDVHRRFREREGVSSRRDLGNKRKREKERERQDGR